VSAADGGAGRRRRRDRVRPAAPALARTRQIAPTPLGPDVRVALRDGKGVGDAPAGFAAATGDIIIMIDADGSTDPSGSAAPDRP
jgi:hypothetical protein